MSILPGMAAQPPAESETAAPRRGEELDVLTLEAFLAANLEGFSGPLDVEQFPYGSANLTYLLRTPSREYVLRRPPLGPVAPGAHDMVREHKVLSRLWQHFPVAPRAFLLCDDPAILGATFFVMERRTGVVIRTELPPGLASAPNAARRAAFAMVDAMAALHSVDYHAAGLGDLGKPAGFAERQLAGWNKRWEVAATPDNPLPGVEEVGALLLQRLPAAAATSLIHNDLKLDNCQFQPGQPDTVTSVFDWDMATLGDPLFDLGTLLGYWSEATDEFDRSPSTGLTGTAGLPTRRELAERYAESRHVPLDTIAWYEAFALWKTVIVLQQMYVRYVRGQTLDERFATVIERQPGLLAMARETALRAPRA